MLGVMSSVGDPVFVRQRRRRVDDELFGVQVVFRRCLHLHGVVPEAELGQTEAADVIQRVDALQKHVVVPVRA